MFWEIGARWLVRYFHRKSESFFSKNEESGFEAMSFSGSHQPGCGLRGRCDRRCVRGRRALHAVLPQRRVRGRPRGRPLAADDARVRGLAVRAVRRRRLARRRKVKVAERGAGEGCQTAARGAPEGGPWVGEGWRRLLDRFWSQPQGDLSIRKTKAEILVCTTRSNSFRERSTRD